MGFKEDEEDVEDAVVDEEEDIQMIEEENKTTKLSQNKVIKTTHLIQTSLKVLHLVIIQMFQIAMLHSPVSYKYKAKVRNYATHPNPVSYKFKGKIRKKSCFKQ